MSEISASDIPKGNWVERLLPAGLRPYARMARFDRPIGTWLLLFPCWWSLGLAAEGWPSMYLFVLFGLGAMVMRGAGCTFNDITDRDFDGRVARTADRPIPSGAVSVTQAVIYMGALALIGLAILMQFNRFAVIVGAASLLLIVIYPFMKRVTYWPQFFLGLAFNWGALLGWAAVRGDLGLPAYLLYAAGIFWTLGYDTIYAHQDKEDDALVGIKSLAIKFGSATRPYLYIFYAIAIALMAASGWAAGLSWPFYALLAAGAVQLAWQARDIDLDDPVDCLVKFKSNRLFGWLLVAAMIAGRVV
ncbi:MAG: 4-hydroxybenzoate octaprenyltransferase [Rhodospirillaceae bacterium]|jgi:4-hydroxybenzoate polyprenyltransferase|nr:4-hydroxybenzoate octaprenyltransferase [Rhodospirillaceae bacterium]MBT4117839.1 4-hydroxybenzoate octaprenyltransferase [Rhodospirillaceae bacterium]MBT4672967.1 4-hydroxybenzoate octaprenyltransferase [Rhodospirillaceae bacterium]MBT4720535.1 4-hydroxybenzoate octaprenyltransferase [Rhodospirillaceae bacterium]MBT4750197.1 4-hydroxybenzoate octaprenyltransferase [Rhodospirillaceae bacterium]